MFLLVLFYLYIILFQCSICSKNYITTVKFSLKVKFALCEGGLSISFCQSKKSHGTNGTIRTILIYKDIFWNNTGTKQNFLEQYDTLSESSCGATFWRDTQGLLRWNKDDRSLKEDEKKPHRSGVSQRSWQWLTKTNQSQSRTNQAWIRRRYQKQTIEWVRLSHIATHR